MKGHESKWDYDEDGWPIVICACGWGMPFSYPDAETAADSWGEHMYEVGHASALSENGRKGGKRSLETMTPSERSDRARKAAVARHKDRS